MGQRMTDARWYALHTAVMLGLDELIERQDGTEESEREVKQATEAWLILTEQHNKRKGK